MATPQCCADPPTLNPAGGEGKVVDSFGGITAYVSGARVQGRRRPHLRRLRPIQVWLKEHAPGKAFEEAKPVIAALKEQGVSTVGAAGYCWGAGENNEIHAAVMSHPSFVTVEDIKEVKCPIAVLGAEIDKTSPPELVKQFEQIAHFVKIFPGVSHGWTVRYKSEDAGAVKSAEEALSDMIDWFSKNLQ
ncbi:hypothetical protein ZWY2020_043341 [Hordeum vulgare]|nr:hypothetical protein ZWY2020_043341 [Hordeum vulgare]